MLNWNFYVQTQKKIQLRLIIFMASTKARLNNKLLNKVHLVDNKDKNGNFVLNKNTGEREKTNI